MREVLEIAESDGVEVPESTIEEMLESDGVYYSPSMLVDIRKGNYIEVEVILGNAFKFAMKNDVECPILTLIYNFLHINQMRTKRRNMLLLFPLRDQSNYLANYTLFPILSHLA